MNSPAAAHQETNEPNEEGQVTAQHNSGLPVVERKYPSCCRESVSHEPKHEAAYDIGFGERALQGDARAEDSRRSSIVES